MRIWAFKRVIKVFTGGLYMGFIYQDNKQVKKEFKKKVIDNNLTMTEVAKRCDMIPQELNNKFANSRLALSDLKEWCNAMECDLVINFAPRKQN